MGKTSTKKREKMNVSQCGSKANKNRTTSVGLAIG